jgi:thioredoxin reductase (NADPH)
MSLDIIIIGGGAAGISAALWSDELKLKALLLEGCAELGGQLMRVYNPIKNHLGTEAENGRELRDRFLKQIKNHQFDVRLQAKIARVDFKNKSVTVDSGASFSAQAIIIAAGVRRRKLNIEGEKEFQKRGIIESGKRDARLVEGKNVCIIGGGDAAFENALILSETAASVTLVHRRADFRARPEFIEQVKKNQKVEILTETAVSKITGGERVEAVKLENLKTGKIIRKKVEALLIRIGVEPNTNFLRKELELDEQGYIKINQICETNIENVFAIGDVANPVAPTISSAVGMGATAAKAISARLNP